MEGNEPIQVPTPRTDSLVNRIKILLGGSVVKLEMSDDDIKEMIATSYDMIRGYINDTDYISVVAAPVIQLDPDIIDVVRVIESPTHAMTEVDEFNVRIIDPKSMRRNAVLNMAESEFEYQQDRAFRFIDHKVYLDDYWGEVTLEVVREGTYENLKDERALKWIFEYSLALCKITVGRIRTKFKPTNVPVELDGDTLLSEGQSEVERLNNSIVEEGFGAFYITR